MHYSRQVLCIVLWLMVLSPLTLFWLSPPLVIRVFMVCAAVGSAAQGVRLTARAKAEYHQKKEIIND